MADQSYWVAKAAFIEGRMENVLERKKQLYTLQEMLVKELPRIEIGLHEDLQRDSSDAVAEVDLVVRTIRDIYGSLDFEKTQSDEDSVARGESYIRRKKPAGVVLIISGSWNPFALSLIPLAMAIASGCPAILYLPARAPSCSEIISEILARSVDQEAYHAISEKKSSTLIELCRLPFDVVEIQYLNHQPQINSTLRKANFRSQINEIHRGVVAAVVWRSADLKTAASELSQAVSRFNGTSPMAPRVVFVDEVEVEKLEKLLITHLEYLPKNTDSRQSTDESYYEDLKKQRPGSRVFLNDTASYGSTGLVVLDSEDSISPDDLSKLSSKARDANFIILLPITSLDKAIDIINKMNEKEMPQVTYAFADPGSGAYLSNFINSVAISINHIFLEDLITVESSLRTFASISLPVKCSPSRAIPSKIASRNPLSPFIAANLSIKKIRQAPGYRLSYFEQGALVGLGIYGLLGSSAIWGAFKLYAMI